MILTFLKTVNKSFLEIPQFRVSDASSRLLLLFSCSVVSDSFTTPWTVACQAPLSMEFPRQSGGKQNKTKQNTTGVDHHFLFQGILPTQGLKCVSCIAGGFFRNTELPGKPFLMLRPQLFILWKEYHRYWSYVRYILSRVTWCLFVLWLVLILIVWLQWCLPGFSIVK